MLCMPADCSVNAVLMEFKFVLYYLNVLKLLLIDMADQSSDSMISGYRLFEQTQCGCEKFEGL